MNAAAPDPVLARQNEGYDFGAGDCPIPRMGTTGDMAETATFLVSPAASCIAGELIRVSDGAGMGDDPCGLNVSPARVHSRESENCSGWSDDDRAAYPGTGVYTWDGRAGDCRSGAGGGRRPLRGVGNGGSIRRNLLRERLRARSGDAHPPHRGPVRRAVDSADAGEDARRRRGHATEPIRAVPGSPRRAEQSSR